MNHILKKMNVNVAAVSKSCTFFARKDFWTVLYALKKAFTVSDIYHGIIIPQNKYKYIKYISFPLKSFFSFCFQSQHPLGLTQASQPIRLTFMTCAGDRGECTCNGMLFMCPYMPSVISFTFITLKCLSGTHTHAHTNTHTAHPANQCNCHYKNVFAYTCMQNS